MNNSINPQYMQYLLQQLSPNIQGQVANNNNPYVQILEQGLVQQPQNNIIASDFDEVMRSLYNNPQSNPNINQNAIPQNYKDYTVIDGYAIRKPQRTESASSVDFGGSNVSFED